MMQKSNSPNQPIPKSRYLSKRERVILSTTINHTSKKQLHINSQHFKECRQLSTTPFPEFKFAQKPRSKQPNRHKTSNFPCEMQFGDMPLPPHAPLYRPHHQQKTRRCHTRKTLLHISVILPIYETNIKKKASNLKKSKKIRLLFGHTEKKIYFCDQSSVCAHSGCAT